jgi:hypothetical protein
MCSNCAELGDKEQALTLESMAMALEDQAAFTRSLIGRLVVPDKAEINKQMAAMGSEVYPF